MTSRREFVLASAAVLGANDRIRAAVIGSGGRGQLLTGEFKELGTEIAAVCDVYEPNLNAGLKIASTGAKAYNDYRRVLEDKALDAVIIATPDHWHARMAIDAVEAGKDVYLEKPMAHTIAEGADIVKAVRRTGRVVQVGTQRRSFDVWIEGKQIVDAGKLGNIRLVSSIWLNRQGDFPERKLEGKLDWQQWLGPAAKRDLDAFRFFNWYYFFDYSGGLLVGQAAHVVDAIQWFMNSKYPLAVTCSGGKPNLKGVEVTDTASILMEYPENYFATFTLGYKAMRYHTFNDQLTQFHGERVRLDMGRESYALYPETSAMELKPVAEKKQPGAFWKTATTAHVRNFLECIRSRKDPNAPVEGGQATNIVLTMALDSLRSGKRIQYNPETGRVRS
ncbi:MAG TPA: Gfo/Idh/MocA family oxidoreductase [Bryobacteraceae bacterium]|nr:Gfo/Idh/MocA family oxidoreductase [Bryobacteraceae bacterium]